jgi:hypothetical protein
LGAVPGGAAGKREEHVVEGRLPNASGHEDHAGVVERRPSAEDRRVKALVVTDKGRVAHARLKAAWLDPPPAMLALNDSDQRTLRRLARKLVVGTDTSGVLPFLRPR